MAFMESIEKLPRARKLQIFATDLNEALLDKARHGLYAKSLVQDISPERLRRFFVEEEGGYRVIKSLREMVVFARQNLIQRPALLAHGPDQLPQPADLSRAELAEEGAAHVPLRAQAGRIFVPGRIGIHRRASPTCLSRWTRKHKIYSRKTAPTPAFHLPVRKEPGDRSPQLRAGATDWPGQLPDACRRTGRFPRRAQRPARGRPHHGQPIRSARRARSMPSCKSCSSAGRPARILSRPRARRASTC